MKVIGVTGGIGMGKSTAGAILAKVGVAVIDTDLLARSCTAPGSASLEEIGRSFGPEVLLSDGSLDRGALAARVFANPSERALLEEILHPRIHALWKAELSARSAEGILGAAVLIPLLFEKGYERDFDVVVTVGATESTQFGRLCARGWDASQIQGRLAAQLPAAEKMRRARYVVWTEGDLDVHARQWRRILTGLGLLSG